VTTETSPAEAADFDLAAFLTASVPMVRTLGLEYLEITPQRAVLRLPDHPDFRNHLAGPHAGAMFTLAESATGAVVIAAFGDQMGRATPLPIHAEIDFKKVARGAVTATAELGRPIADVLAELDAGRRPDVPVTVRIEREDGAVTGEMSVLWVLRPNA
jgi:acyl-coenzyme A thioesterase PaaI-like protein